MFHGPAIGFGHGFYAVVSAIIGFLGSLILFAIIAGVLFFLIRFLIVGTKAAQLYIDKNRPVAPVVEPVETTPTITTPTAPPATTPPASTSSTSVAPKAAARPAPKPRTPKTPPSPDL
jgi:cell division septation protein DedD